MRPVSDAFLNAIRGSHRAVSQAIVVAPGQTGTDPTGTEITILSGDVQLDAKASVRSTLGMVTDGTGSWPDNASDALAPFGNEVFLRRGIAFGGGAVEWVSLGYHRIDSVEQDEAPNGPIRIAGSDRMVGIVEARLLAPVQYGPTATFGDVVAELVEEVYPWATIEWDDETDADPIGRTVIAEEDRYAFLNDLVTSRGKSWYWDHRGILVIRDVADPEDWVWQVNAGENGVLISLSRDLSREGVYNAVVATGEALDTTTPPRAVAYDDNPDSPTYWDGAFGKVPRFYSSPFITNTSQAGTAAAAVLRQSLGLPYNVDFSQVPNPALEPGDPVAVNLAGSRHVVRLVGRDSFDRTVVDSWSNADSGQAWTISGTAANFDVTGGVGTVAAPTANLAQHARLDGVDESDVEGYFTASVPVAATGAALLFGAVVRRVDASNYYLLSFEFQVGGTVALKLWRVVSGTFNQLAELNPIPGRTYTAGERWICQYRVVGTALKIKAWPEGSVPPPSWQVAATDTTYTSGGVGILFWRVASNTNTGSQFNVDDFSVKSYPGLPSGAEIHVIERLTIPLAVEQPMTAVTKEQTLVVIGEA
jgi:hypothetical protein